MKRLLVILCAISLCGCGIGGMWMNGNLLNDGVPSVAPRDRWVGVEPVSETQRSNDWIECGGDYRGTTQNRFVKFPGEEDESNNARAEYANNVERCMLKKSYKYTGECTPSSSQYPSCRGF